MFCKEVYGKCLKMKIMGFYFDLCLFDFLIMGDENFSVVVWYVLDDLFLLDEMGIL